MANFQAKRPATTVAVGYVEQAVDDWIKSRIRGVPWTPGPIPEHPRLIRKNEMLRRVGLSYPTVWELEKRGKFPTRIRLAADPEPVGRPRGSRVEGGVGRGGRGGHLVLPAEEGA
jgi:predicted DNA-binding transcriptional regulator AlpA